MEVSNCWSEFVNWKAQMCMHFTLQGHSAFFQKSQASRKTVGQQNADPKCAYSCEVFYHFMAVCCNVLYSLLKWFYYRMEISVSQSFISRCFVCHMFLRGARILHRCRGVLAQTVWFFCRHNWACVGSLAGNTCSHVCLWSQEVSNLLQ